MTRPSQAKTAEVAELERDARRVSELAQTAAAKAAGLERVRVDLEAALAKARLDAQQGKIDQGGGDHER